MKTLLTTAALAIAGLSLFPEDRGAGVLADTSIVHVKLSQLQLRRPRQWGRVLAGVDAVA